MSPVQKPDDHLDHALYVLGRPGFHIGPQDPQSVHVLIKGVNVFQGKGFRLFPQFLSPLNDLVIHISKVPDISDIKTLGSEVPYQYIKHDGGSGMTNMTEIIDGYSADIDAYLTFHQRSEGLFFASGSII